MVKNPQGFTQPTLATIPEIYLSYDLSALLRKTVHIKEIRLNLDEITMEHAGGGRINLRELGAVKSAPKKGSAKPQDAGAKPEPAQGTKPALAVQIDRVDLSLGRARYVESGTGSTTVKSFPLELKHIVLEDLTDPRQITQQIVLKTVQKIGMTAIAPDLAALPNFDAELASVVENAKQSMAKLAEKLKMPLGGETTVR